MMEANTNTSENFERSTTAERADDMRSKVWKAQALAQLARRSLPQNDDKLLCSLRLTLEVIDGMLEEVAADLE